MTAPTFPSPSLAHRRADMLVHAVGLTLIVVAGSIFLPLVADTQAVPVTLAALVYVVCALASNLASCAYHFAPMHDQRVLLRRIDHAAIYPSITGTFTPFFVLAATPWTWTLLVLCWTLTLVAMRHKITAPAVKSRWSTASYLGLGALGLSALPDLTNVPIQTLWCILAGALAYVIGTVFYTRKSMAYRYAVWHSFVNLGGIAMFAGVWIALFGM